MSPSALDIGGTQIRPTANGEFCADVHRVGLESDAHVGVDWMEKVWYPVGSGIDMIAYRVRGNRQLLACTTINNTSAYVLVLKCWHIRHITILPRIGNLDNIAVVMRYYVLCRPHSDNRYPRPVRYRYHTASVIYVDFAGTVTGNRCPERAPSWYGVI